MDIFGASSGIAHEVSIRIHNGADLVLNAKKDFEYRFAAIQGLRGLCCAVHLVCAPRTSRRIPATVIREGRE